MFLNTYYNKYSCTPNTQLDMNNYSSNHTYYMSLHVGMGWSGHKVLKVKFEKGLYSDSSLLFLDNAELSNQNVRIRVI